MQDFRRLLVWSRAHAFAITIRRLTRRIRDVGYSEYKAQLVSAAESISNNIVEGCGAATNKEFARFLDISIKSTSEVDYRLELGKDYELISESEWRDLWAEAVEIRKMLYALRRTVLSSESNSPRPPHRKPKRPPKTSSENTPPPETDD